jgi:hypothetical protein
MTVVAAGVLDPVLPPGVVVGELAAVVDGVDVGELVVLGVGELVVGLGVLDAVEGVEDGVLDAVDGGVLLAVDGGVLDAVDGGVPLAVLGAGAVEDGAVDAGAVDAGAVDAGAVDAGAVDAGLCGSLVCGACGPPPGPGPWVQSGHGAGSIGNALANPVFSIADMPTVAASAAAARARCVFISVCPSQTSRVR